MSTTLNSPISRLAPAAALAMALTAAPAVWAQTPQDSAAHRTWNVPGTSSTGTPTTTPTTPTRTATGQPVPAQTSAAVQGVADTALVREVRTDNLLEIRLGSLAQKRATNAAVKQFGQRMVTDHTTMGNQWTALATRTHLGTTSALDAAQQQLLSRLTSAPAAQFDTMYISTMVQNHQALINTFQQLGPVAQTQDIRTLAAQGLPTLQEHLTMAQQVANQVGAAVATAGVPQRTPTGQVVTTSTGANNASNNERADAAYVQELLRDHEMQVELAQLVQQKGKDSKVKDFASNMQKDFKDYLDRWNNVAGKHDVSTPNNMGTQHRDKVDRLKNASKNDADRVYLDIVKENLGSLVPYYQKEGRQAKTAAVRNLVNQELPVIQQHLSRAETLDRQVGTASAQSNGKAKDNDKDKDNKNKNK